MSETKRHKRTTTRTMGRVGRILLTMALILASAVTFVGIGVTCGIIPTVNVVTM